MGDTADQSLVENDPKVISNVGIATKLGKDLILDVKIPRHGSGQGFVKVMKSSVMWRGIWNWLSALSTDDQSFSPRSLPTSKPFLSLLSLVVSAGKPFLAECLHCVLWPALTSLPVPPTFW